MQPPLNMLMLSIDGDILDPTSEAALRMKDYGRAVNELHIIVYTKKNAPDVQLSHNVFAYPTRTRHAVFFARDMLVIARRVVRACRERVRWGMTSQDAFTNIAGLLIRKKGGIPLEIQIHTDALNPFFYRESFKNRIRSWLYRYAFTRADSVRVVSNRVKQSFAAYAPGRAGRIYTLPVFVDIRRYEKSKQNANLHARYQKDFIFLMASRLTKEKNIPLALSAYTAVARAYARSLLLIVGDGQEKKNIEQIVKNAGMGQNVVFESRVDAETLAGYYRSADIFVLSSNYEGYGRTLVEAAAAGLPIITTDVGVAREIISHGITGSIVPVGDQTLLEKAMFDCIERYDAFRSHQEVSRLFISSVVYEKDAYMRAVRDGWERLFAPSQ